MEGTVEERYSEAAADGWLSHEELFPEEKIIVFTGEETRAVRQAKRAIELFMIGGLVVGIFTYLIHIFF